MHMNNLNPGNRPKICYILILLFYEYFNFDSVPLSFSGSLDFEFISAWNRIINKRKTINIHQTACDRHCLEIYVNYKLF